MKSFDDAPQHACSDLIRVCQTAPDGTGARRGRELSLGGHALGNQSGLLW